MMHKELMSDEDVEANLAEWRERYSDLTATEVQDIRAHYKYGRALFFRCNFGAYQDMSPILIS